MLRRVDPQIATAVSKNLNVFIFRADRYGFFEVDEKD
jgi:hypothetical protein